jgi:tellurite resistance protein
MKARCAQPRTQCAQREEAMGVEPGTVAGHEPRLAHFPVPLFATVMGLSGLMLSWQKAEHVFHLSSVIPVALAVFTALVFVGLAVLYAAKGIVYPERIAEEYNHPVRLHFIPTISISLILLSIVALEQLPALAHPLFLAGVSLHFVLTMTVLHNWFNRDHFQPVHLNPAWFIPIVGNVLVPLPGVELGYIELSWFFFAIGIVFWVLLFAIILNRVLFHNPLPERLMPTLFILVAPPAVGFLSYVKLTGEMDAVARVLYYFALFLTIFLATLAPQIAKSRFYLSWWAYSFPLGAITIASWVIYEKLGGSMFLGIAITLQAIVTLVVAGLTVRTIVAAVRGEICVPE